MSNFRAIYLRIAVDWEMQTSPSFNQGRLGKWKFFWNSSVFFLSVQSVRSHLVKSFRSAPSGRLTSYIVSFQSAPAYSSKSRAPPTRPRIFQYPISMVILLDSRNRIQKWDESH